MEATARTTFLRMGPRKVRFVLDTIRGKYVDDAQAQLKFTPNFAAGELLKVLNSAVANASHNYDMDTSSMKIVRCWVDVGPSAKRVQPRAQGRAYRILKRTSHITLVIAEAGPKPTTGARELEIKRRGPKPPLRAPLPTPAGVVVENTSAANGNSSDAEEQTTPIVDATQVTTEAETPVVETATGQNAEA